MKLRNAGQIIKFGRSAFMRNWILKENEELVERIDWQAPHRIIFAFIIVLFAFLRQDGKIFEIGTDHFQISKMELITFEFRNRDCFWSLLIFRNCNWSWTLSSFDTITDSDFVRNIKIDLVLIIFKFGNYYLSFSKFDN